MGRYVLKRLLLMIPVIIGTSLIIFLAMNLAQGDYVDTLVLEDMPEEKVAELRAKYNLDKNVFVQYGEYMWGLLHGDMGTSWSSQRPVTEIFLRLLPNTLYLALACCVIGTILAVPLGILSATHRGGIIDNISSLISVLGMSAPAFWLGMMLMLLFSLRLGWLPSGGNEKWYCVLMPAFTLGAGRMAALARTTRSTMVDTLSQDYLRTARAKGVPERTVVTKHAFKPASIPILNIAMTQLAGALSGAALTESVFSWPGVGRQIVSSVQQRDIPTACGCLIMICILVGIVELITDLLYAYVDPRLRTHFATTEGKRRKKANG